VEGSVNIDLSGTSVNICSATTARLELSATGPETPDEQLRQIMFEIDRIVAAGLPNNVMATGWRRELQIVRRGLSIVFHVLRYPHETLYLTQGMSEIDELVEPRHAPTAADRTAVWARVLRGIREALAASLTASPSPAAAAGSESSTSKLGAGLVALGQETVHNADWVRAVRSDMGSEAWGRFCGLMEDVEQLAETLMQRSARLMVALQKKARVR
jgi:hypothetical protein